jgi:hypothetical protein
MHVWVSLRPLLIPLVLQSTIAFLPQTAEGLFIESDIFHKGTLTATKEHTVG